jgi:hypothetical protein
VVGTFSGTTPTVAFDFSGSGILYPSPTAGMIYDSSGGLTFTSPTDNTFFVATNGNSAFWTAMSSSEASSPTLSIYEAVSGAPTQIETYLSDFSDFSGAGASGLASDGINIFFLVGPTLYAIGVNGTTSSPVILDQVNTPGTIFQNLKLVVAAGMPPNTVPALIWDDGLHIYQMATPVNAVND